MLISSFVWLINRSLKQKVWLQVFFFLFIIFFASTSFWHFTEQMTDDLFCKPKLITLLHRSTRTHFPDKNLTEKKAAELTNKTPCDLWPNRWEHLQMYLLTFLGSVRGSEVLTGKRVQVTAALWQPTVRENQEETPQANDFLILCALAQCLSFGLLWVFLFPSLAENTNHWSHFTGQVWLRIYMEAY